MISVQTVVDRLKSVLDAEGSDRYTFNEDFKPAINSSVEWLQAVFNKAFADNKLTEENLKDLIRVSVFQTNIFSRVYLNQATLGTSVWSILRVNPEPTVYPDGSPLTVTNDNNSLYRPDLAFVKSKYSAKRLSLEKWDENSENIFEAGNTFMSNKFKSYAYLNFVNSSSSNYIPGGAEIEIRPEIPKQYVAITYLKYPTPISSITDSIEFPESLINLVYGKAANFISIKQGDQTSLYSVTTRDVEMLVKLMI